MSNKADDFSAKKWQEMTKIIKVISESVKGYIDGKGTLPDRDTSLMAMQVLSILCGYNKGYDKEKMEELWQTSMDAAEKVHRTQTKDVAPTKTLQAPLGFDGWSKN